MPRQVVPGETGWIDCVTNQRHTFEVKLPRLAVAFVPDVHAEGAGVPPGRVRLTATDCDEAHPFGAAADGRDGALELGFQGAPAADASYDALVEPQGGRPYPLFRAQTLGERARRPSRGAPVLARAVVLRLVWRGPHPQDLPPVAGKQVSLELPGVAGAPPAFYTFKTDGEGRLCVEPADATAAANELAWVHLPPGPRRLRLVRGACAPGQAPPPERVREVEVEVVRGKDGGDRFVARLTPPPRLSLPIKVTWPGASSQADAGRAFLGAHTFRVQLDGQDVAHGAQLDESGMVLVVFRCDPGTHDLLITSHATDTPPDDACARRVWFARRITVADR